MGKIADIPVTISARVPQLFPKPPRRMKQPRKDEIRWRAELGEAKAAYAEEARRRADKALLEADAKAAQAIAVLTALLTAALIAVVVSVWIARGIS